VDGMIQIKDNYSLDSPALVLVYGQLDGNLKLSLIEIVSIGCPQIHNSYVGGKTSVVQVEANQ
jgi:hypothetical protein